MEPLRLLVTLRQSCFHQVKREKFIRVCIFMSCRLVIETLQSYPASNFHGESKPPVRKTLLNHNGPLRLLEIM